MDNTFVADSSRREIYNLYGCEDQNRKSCIGYHQIANKPSNSYDMIPALSLTCGPQVAAEARQDHDGPDRRGDRLNQMNEAFDFA